MFLEMLRQQNTSTMRCHIGVAKDMLYEPVEYIHWVMSEKMLAVVGDLKKGGEENDYFMRDPGGFQKTVSENYQLLYLYYLGILLSARREHEICKKVERSKDRKGYEELIERVLALGNMPMERLSSEERIKVLFEKYLCWNTWELQQNVEKLLNDDLPLLITNKPHDIFISYKRKGGFYPARLLYELLKSKNKKPFMDLIDLGSGHFEKHIYEVIETCDAVLVILTEGCLDCCADESDWMRKEIIKAVEVQKNRQIKIIPIMIDGFDFPKNLPKEITISKENAVSFTPKSFRGDFERLCELLDGKSN